MKKILLPLIVFGISFVYFVKQACPTFYFWDSAELTAAVLGGGVPHPPGFPSLLISAKLWNWILPIEKAYGLNLLSAFFAAIGLAFWYLVVGIFILKIYPRKNSAEISVLSLISTFVLGMTFSYGIQAVRFEVYSMNFACFAILMFLVSKMAFLEFRKSYIYAGIILITAISLGGHHFTIALTIPGMIWLLYNQKKLTFRGILLCVVGIAILIIPLYLSLYLLSLKNPPLNWGDPSSPGRFIDYFFLREFSLSLSSLGPGHLKDNLAFAVNLIAGQIGILGAVLALWGIVKFVRLKPGIFVPVLVILVLNIFSIIYFEDYFNENYDLHGYLLFTLALSSLFYTMIIAYISTSLLLFIKNRVSGMRIYGSLIITILVAFVTLYMPAKKNLFSVDLSKIDAPLKYSDLFLKNVPNNALVVTSYYNTYFCLLALQAVQESEDSRYFTNVYNWDHDWGRDVTSERLGFKDDGIKSASKFYMTLLNTMKGKRPIYVEYDDSSAPLANFLKPEGLCYRFSISDTSLGDPYSQIMEIDEFSKIASKYEDIEWLRTWVLWFHNRGEFYRKRGNSVVAQRYFAAADRLAAGGP